MGWIARSVLVAAGAGVALVGAAGAAGADAVTEGDCFGDGTWLDAGFTERSEDHDPSDVIEVPRADTVEWVGGIGGASPGEQGPEREIEGEVVLVLPTKSTIAVDDWGPNDSTTYGNSGTHDYDLPSVLIGVKMRLEGEHRENGEVVCAGSVYVQVEGSPFKNPLTFVGLAGMLLSGGVLVLAGKVAA
jgi:hypothetical protein